ncbi:hypothetical protein [Asticcacaulis sp. YBE204]|uniref:VpaChn25_0724 family phage protein n=1 Tax=Asticcacaulis sp. YBE204 TaxID=1282363 RepID=UPI0003C3F1A8|nr:hypothetical protein [Asticcacaulis sp. YBE204]ESQ78444.1 hypothetical protein AEYBE204_13170 [Asticcacaulis sp. YBE204]
MIPFAEYEKQNIRLCILRVLTEASNKTANQSVIQIGLRSHSGVRASREEIVGYLDWLHQRGLVEREELSTSVVMATLTAYGEDVARGFATATGVESPTKKG